MVVGIKEEREREAQRSESWNNLSSGWRTNITNLVENCFYSGNFFCPDKEATVIFCAREEDGGKREHFCWALQNFS